MKSQWANKFYLTKNSSQQQFFVTKLTEKNSPISKWRKILNIVKKSKQIIKSNYLFEIIQLISSHLNKLQLIKIELFIEKQFSYDFYTNNEIISSYK